MEQNYVTITLCIVDVSAAALAESFVAAEKNRTAAEF